MKHTTTLTTSLAFVALLVCATAPAHAAAQEAAEKSRIAVSDITATAAVRAQADADGQRLFLDQVVEGCDRQLEAAIARTGKFDIVARADLRALRAEQAIQNSGIVDTLDPQAAKLFQGAGARYWATITIDNFQSVTTRAVLDGQLGASNAERRLVEFQAVLKVFDTTGGVLLHASSIPVSASALNEVLVGQQQEGRSTNAVLGAVTLEFTTATTNALVEALFPAKVVGYTLGIVTFNRGSGSGVVEGQSWRVYATGDQMTDPDTGAPLGREEIPIAWVKVIEVGTQTSKGQAYDDRGIDRGSIMRLTATGPTESSVRSDNSLSKQTSADSQMGNSQTATRASSASSQTQDASSPSAVSPTAISPGARPRLAIFVKSRLPGEDSHVMVFEDAIVACLGGGHLSIISREDVLNAVSRYAQSGANRGTHNSAGDPTGIMADLELSDQSSARALAANMGADALLVASITSLTNSQTTVDNAQLDIHSRIKESRLTVGYRVIDGATGGTLSAGDVVVAFKQTDEPNFQQPEARLDELLRDAATRLCARGDLSLAAAAAAQSAARASSSGGVSVNLNPSAADLSIPEVIMVNGQPVIAPVSYQLEPAAVMVKIDGVLAGSAPGAFVIPLGMHRIHMERPLFEPVDVMINVREGMGAITIPMKLTQAGLHEWRENAKFFLELKEGAALTAAQVDQMRAFADFLRNSSMRLDTSAVRNLNLGGESLWNQIFFDP